MRAKGSCTSPPRCRRPGASGTDDTAMDELADLIAAAGGRTLALFSSWRGVERAAEQLAELLPDRLLDRGIVPPDVAVLVQKRGDSVADLVSRFAGDPRSVLLGTLSLWQGVDVPGEACHLVVIDRIPFPRPDDPLVAARSQFAEDHGGNGFTAVSVPRAALLLAQGVGRLIRSSSRPRRRRRARPAPGDRPLRRLPAHARCRRSGSPPTPRSCAARSPASTSSPHRPSRRRRRRPRPPSPRPPSSRQTPPPSDVVHDLNMRSCTTTRRATRAESWSRGSTLRRRRPRWTEWSRRGCRVRRRTS